MSCESGTNSPKTGDKESTTPNRLPRFLFLGSHHKECQGELTLDASTLKDIWGDEPVALALASMLKAVLEGRVSSKKLKDDDVEENSPPPDDAREARLALVEVFECFSSGLTPESRPVHILDIDSLLARQRELSEARKAASEQETKKSSSSDDQQGSDDSSDQDSMSAEEEMITVLLNLVYAIRKKHRSPSSSSPPQDISEVDDHSLTFGIVDTCLSSCDKEDFDKDWLLVCRETKKQQSSENGIYPIQSIYSFFLVLNSEDLMQSSSSSSSQSPSSDSADDVPEAEEGESQPDGEEEHVQEEVEEEEDDAVSVTPESDESKGTPSDKGDASPQEPSSKSSLFRAVKKHEENSWSVLAALHEDGTEKATTVSEGDSCHIPDVTVIVDPLRIIGEYIRYLQGKNAPPRTEQRKRRRVHVHESTVQRPSCKIRILTPIDDDDDEKSLSPADRKEHRNQILQDKMFHEQEELRHLLEQRLRELQQSIEQEESTHQPVNTLPPPS